MLNVDFLKQSLRQLKNSQLSFSAVPNIAMSSAALLSLVAEYIIAHKSL